MAGLAPHAANFFKFLFILVLYTLAMALYVSCFPHHWWLVLNALLELLIGNILLQRWNRHPAFCPDGFVPNDLCRVFRPLE